MSPFVCHVGSVYKLELLSDPLSVCQAFSQSECRLYPALLSGVCIFIDKDFYFSHSNPISDKRKKIDGRLEFFCFVFFKLKDYR